jgi:hypothetical protein
MSVVDRQEWYETRDAVRSALAEYIGRVHDTAERLNTLSLRSRETIARSREVLARPVPF